jgi:hypothetical protein
MTSASVRAAHKRVRNHPRTFPENVDGDDHVAADPALMSPRSRLLSDLNVLPGPCTGSRVFQMSGEEVGLPGVRLFVRSEEQPYLRGAINAMERLIDSEGIVKLRQCGVVGQENSMLTFLILVMFVVANR